MWVCLVDGKVEENSGAIDFFFGGGGGLCYQWLYWTQFSGFLLICLFMFL